MADGAAERPKWEDDTSVVNCNACTAGFTITRRKHHCRACGKIFCNECTPFRAPLPKLQYFNPERVCRQCKEKLDKESVEDEQSSKFYRRVMQIELQNTFAFAIDPPKKRAAGAGPIDLFHWVYTLHSKTRLEQYPQKEMTTDRRFSDFYWLRQMLVAQNPGIIVPKTPPKDMQTAADKVMTVSSDVFLAERQKRLLLFLVALAAHPVLSMSPTLQAFLELAPEKFEEFKTRQNKTTKLPDVMQGAKELIYTFKSIGPAETAELEAQLAAENGVDSTAAGAPQRKYNKDKWEDVKRYFADQQIATFRSYNRLRWFGDERRDTFLTLHAVGDSFYELAKLDAGDGALSRDYTVAGKGATEASALIHGQLDIEETLVADVMYYYMQMFEAAKDTTAALLDKMLSRDTLTDERSSLNTQNDATAADQIDKKKKLGVKIAELDLKINTLNEEIATFESLLRSEISRLVKQKAVDWRSFMGILLMLQKTLSQKVHEVTAALDPILVM